MRLSSTQVVAMRQIHKELTVARDEAAEVSTEAEAMYKILLQYHDRLSDVLENDESIDMTHRR